MDVARFATSIWWETSSVDEAENEGGIGGIGEWEADVMPALSERSNGFISPRPGT